ncbi:MAG TPA: hypothetical protein VFX03_12635, partial [Thermomicrobiales bacterium]|nr:hypothetical protein [Thermomicrobiales bacterium]
MNDAHFDRFATRFGAGFTRRSGLGALLATAATGLPGRADAQSRPGGHEQPGGKGHRDGQNAPAKGKKKNCKEPK